MKGISVLRGAAAGLLLLLFLPVSGHSAELEWHPVPPDARVKNPPVPRGDGRFIVDAYGRLLGRDPTLPEAAVWKERLASGAVKRETMIETLTASDEYFVRRQFLDLLVREPKPGELAERLAFLKEGGGRKQITVNILESPEYRAIQNDSP